MRYDEQFLLKAAIRLESEARNIIFATAARYALISGLTIYIGGILVRAFASRQIGDVPVGAVAIIVALIGMTFGIIAGRDKAFALRVQEHQLLALVQIEHNTQPIGNASETPPIVKS